ncbi:MAG TPA: MFS transporter, partial [Kribbellaceae bacterium]|nr:MFS transporter [Kribbellaceae bacterium]
SLDALIQRDVPETVRTSVFARSETVLQLAWVLGGGCGIVMPLVPRLGFGFLAAVLLVLLLAVLRRSGPAPARPMAKAPAASQPPAPNTPAVRRPYDARRPAGRPPRR